MFDIGWSELLIIGVMALIVVGPKDLPVLLRTLGRYLGVIRRQAAEFRTQFDEALRETEFDQIRKDVAGLKEDLSSTVREAGRQVEKDLEGAKDLNRSLQDASAKETLAAKAPKLSESNEGTNGAAASKAGDTAEAMPVDATTGAGREAETVAAGRETAESHAGSAKSGG